MGARRNPRRQGALGVLVLDHGDAAVDQIRRPGSDSRLGLHRLRRASTGTHARLHLDNDSAMAGADAVAARRTGTRVAAAGDFDLRRPIPANWIRPGTAAQIDPPLS